MESEPTMIDLGLSGKRGVVAGAGHIRSRAGHGRHTTLQLARAGVRLACIDIDRERAHEIVAQAQAEGAEAYPIVADMTDAAQVERAISEAVQVLGGIDVCVDVIGGVRKWSKVEETTTDEWNWSIENNLTQVFRLFQAVSRQMIDQGTGGSLVALASVDGTSVAAAYHAPYGAAKAGLIHLAKTFAYELGRYGIRVNMVAPGNVGTGNDDQPEGIWAVDDINPLIAPRAIDIANAALFLSSALAARITGQTIIVDGGATIRQAWSASPQTLHHFETPSA
jgi:NAD(P)-dependent dehydrogenase (short-subunit alcohol dehydrogenase family)